MRGARIVDTRLPAHPRGDREAERRRALPAPRGERRKQTLRQFLRPVHRNLARAVHQRGVGEARHQVAAIRSEEHTSELQSLMRISYAVFCLKKQTYINLTVIEHLSCHSTTIADIHIKQRLDEVQT